MAIETRELTCINCPLGCQLAVTVDGGSVVSVAGNGCARGAAYGREEVVNPTRTVTTTVCAFGSPLAHMLPVKTAAPVPKAKVRAVVAALADVAVTAPVALGTVVARDVAGTGVDVVATRALPAVRAVP